jgi:hypothetical protein
MANSFKNAGAAVLAETRTVLYGPVPTNTAAVIHALYVSNINGQTAATVDIEITVDGGVSGDNGGTQEFIHIGKTLAVPEDSTLVLDKPINLEAGDVLALTASTVDHIEAVCSILEITTPV